MNSGKSLTLLSPAPHLCQQCAVQHEPTEPHNWQSLHWAFWFQSQHGRSPMLADAFEHCTTEVCDRWAAGLSDMGHHKLAIQVAGLSSLKKSKQVGEDIDQWLTP